jgi:hypothetical protein
MEAIDPGLYAGNNEGVPFEPDTIQPDQFFGSSRGPAEGERRLMAAVLIDAIDCYVTYRHAQTGRGRLLFRDAERWIMRGRPGAPLAFETACAALGLAPADVRRRLRQGRAVFPDRGRGPRPAPAPAPLLAASGS